MNFQALAHEMRALADDRERTPENAKPAMDRLLSLAARRYAELANNGVEGFDQQLSRAGVEFRKSKPFGDDDPYWVLSFRQLATVLAFQYPARLGHALTLGAMEAEPGGNEHTTAHTHNPARWRDSARDYARVCDLLAEADDAEHEADRAKADKANTESDWRPARWFKQATGGGLYPDLLKQANKDNRIQGRKVGNRWHYSIEQVMMLWPEYRQKADKHREQSEATGSNRNT